MARTFIQVGVTAEEKAKIKSDAARAGCSMSSWVRDRLLDKCGPVGSDDSSLPNSPGPQPSTEGDPGLADPEFNPPLGISETEAQFLERRRRELFAQGKTSRIAAQMALREWEAR